MARISVLLSSSSGSAVMTTRGFAALFRCCAEARVAAAVRTARATNEYFRSEFMVLLFHKSVLQVTAPRKWPSKPFVDQCRCLHNYSVVNDMSPQIILGETNSC